MMYETYNTKEAQLLSHLIDNTHSFWFLGIQDISVAAKESTAARLEAIKIKYEEAVELKKRAELDIEAFRPVGYILFADIHFNVKLDSYFLRKWCLWCRMLTEPPPHALPWRKDWSSWKLKLNS